MIIRDQKVNPEMITIMLLRWECNIGTGNLLPTHVGVLDMTAVARRVNKQRAKYSYFYALDATIIIIIYSRYYAQRLLVITVQQFNIEMENDRKES